MKKFPKSNIIEEEGISFLFSLCQDLNRLVSLKEESLLEATSSEVRIDVKAVHSATEDLVGIYSSMLSIFHEFARKVSISFKDISKTSEYLMVLSKVISEKGVDINKGDFKHLLSESFDLYSNISDLLNGYLLFSQKYQKLINLLSDYDDSKVDGERFVENVKSLVRGIVPWRRDLWRFVEKTYHLAQSVENRYNHIISTYGLQEGGSE